MIDDAFDALANVHRRRLLVDLLEHDPQNVAEMPGVPWKIAESDETGLRKRHVHLPKLVDYGYVEWDREGGVAARGPRFDEIRPVLELIDDNRDDLPAELL